ncbi:MAG: hypothetical protein HYU28_10225 [Actinobacteria bacterium]|nr:hypothetical protein [Actinomycetota bacterium]
MGGRASRKLALVGLTAVVVAAGLLGAASPAAADGPGVGSPWVVSLGDSAISGEAGRWAGNTNDSYTKVDALGADAYFDNASRTGEQIPGCHRSESAAIHIGGGVNSLNLACSGARTYTHGGGDSDFKPGIDFYAGPYGQGQALALQQFAGTHNVKMVALMIGANDYGFADILQTCFLDWYFSPSWWPDYCNDDADIASRFTPESIEAKTEAIKGAILNVRQAMASAGYADSAYTIMLHTYWSPVPRGAQNRYPETGYTRQTVGGCGMWNRDADWANDTVVPTFNSSVRNAATRTGLSNIRTLDLTQSLYGRRLCENTVGLLEEAGISSWTKPKAVDKTEWVNQLRTSSTVGSPYQIQESVHANYWGQRAMRNCMRLAYNGGSPRGGNCVRSSTGLNSLGEPKMALQ